MTRLAPTVFSLAVLTGLSWIGGSQAALAQSCTYAGLPYDVGTEECIAGKRATCVADSEATGGARFEIQDVPCHHRIEITNAKYGMQDHWCSATSWVERFCGGRLTCKITVPKGSVDSYDYEERRKLKDSVVCGPVSVVERHLAVSWFCTDGNDYFTQPRTTIADTESDTMTCARY